MSVRFEIRMTPQAMYSFMLHHNYTQLSGILEVVFGTVILATGLKQAESGKTAGAVLLFFIAAPVFKKPLCYELTDSGVKVIQEDRENENPWQDFQRAVSTGQALVLYMDKSRAVIFPRNQIGEKWAAAAEMISTHMPPDKVRIRQVN